MKTACENQGFKFLNNDITTTVMNFKPLLIIRFNLKIIAEYCINMNYSTVLCLFKKMYLKLATWRLLLVIRNQDKFSYDTNTRDVK